MKSSEFRALTSAPLNGAPSPAALIRNHITGVADFFVRNHGEVPGPPKPGTETPLSLRVTGLVQTPLDLPFPDPSVSPVSAQAPRYPFLATRSSIESSLQCAGNRRTSLQRIRQIPNEVPWTNEAIGNAIWEGISLKEILDHSILDPQAKHVWFLGSEALTGKHAGEKFGASIPIEKAIDGSVILADTMNGAPLTANHGAPLRAIVPGYIGARSVKWLAEIRVEREPSPNYFQRAYSVFPSTMLAVPHGNTGGIVLGEMPLNSAFAAPEDGARVSPGTLTARGWSLAGGDRLVERVEVSADGGTTWAPARFLSPAKKFVWRIWEAELTLGRGEHELVCRAFDNAGNHQPSNPADVWNVKGYANNSWDRVRIGAL